MNCIHRDKQESRRFTMVFRRDELMYDIGQSAYVEGDVVQSEDNHAKHQIFDILSDGNENLAARMLNTAYREAVELLYPFTEEEIEDESTFGNELEIPDEYVIHMNVPKMFAKAGAESLRDHVHQYLVGRVVGEWMSTTNYGNPSSIRAWNERIETIRQQIKLTVCWRRGPLRRRLSTF